MDEIEGSARHTHSLAFQISQPKIHDTLELKPAHLIHSLTLSL